MYAFKRPASEIDVARESTEDARDDYHRALKKWGANSVDTEWYRQRLDHAQAAEDALAERLLRARGG